MKISFIDHFCFAGIIEKSDSVSKNAIKAILLTCNEEI